MSATYFLRTTDMAALEQLGVDLGLLKRHTDKAGKITIAPANLGRDMWDVIGVLSKGTGEFKTVQGDLGSFEVELTTPVLAPDGTPYQHVNLTLGLTPEIDPVTRTPMKAKMMQGIVAAALAEAGTETAASITAALSNPELFFIYKDGEAVDPKNPVRISL